MRVKGNKRRRRGILTTVIHPYWLVTDTEEYKLYSSQDTYIIIYLPAKFHVEKSKEVHSNTTLMHLVGSRHTRSTVPMTKAKRRHRPVTLPSDERVAYAQDG